MRVGSVPDAEPLAVSLPWLARDAFVHFLAPRGLEQFTGGAWGTRDVAQGPLELLLALDRLADASTLLLRIFAAQSTDGTWPQAFGFLPGDEHFRREPAHGDVVHWPVLALARYLLASGDGSLLDEKVAWYTPADADPVAASTLRDHLEAALAAARAHVLPGTSLVAYGHGDWNDSLQPADPTLAATMTSAWTATLHRTSLLTLADGLACADADEVTVVDDLRAEAAAIADDLRRHLLVDGELAGYAQLDPPGVDGRVEVRRLLVHPRDTETGLHHGSLQMIHALGDDLLDLDEAAHHIALVREHLTGVDGIRLFDRPPPYSGGLMRHFQRAETATFVGREIGLMYVHAHLRWCEAMARWGDADAVWLALMQSLPHRCGRRRARCPAAPVEHLRVELGRGVPGPGRLRRAVRRRAHRRDRARGRAGGSTPPARGCCCGSSCTRCSASAGARRPSRSTRSCRRGSTGSRRRCRSPGACCACATAWAIAATRRRPCASVVATCLRSGRANPYRLGGLVVALADLDAALQPDGDELEVVLP